ncbi:DNA cytosine methyltransferase [Gluconacetobacter diazotrophicus]|uniref:DNA (cytosine-5-)-methyltransferase n=1 Tax=Gluconacetobacter diazotrophicus TaxID=33996 RepID=A0A7W4I6M1_GLUDI|nr:DNA cytosine methyltransferase [Gluconacetobacter diazotrophicus]MBB2157238.1 DNA cytosine methyltransferase [Gluconacetobacter diazotrophicus]
MNALTPIGRLAPKQWSLDTAINVVLFAGLGGACAGLEDAGLPVHVANNHDPVALAAHAALFPHTRHVKGDIFDVDPLVATGGRPVNVLWASPDCRDHSVAKGAAPRSARVRSLPWQVCRWAGKTRPLVIMMENVREIRGWGPLIAKRDKATGRVLKLDGTVAARGEHVPRHQQQLVRDKRHIGRTYRAFVSHIRGLMGDYQDRDICCADHGIPTSRRRWFAVARRDGQPIEWPEQTHAPADQAKARGLRPWVGAHTIIDWSIPMRSIFDRTKPLAANTNHRIAVGLRKFVLESPRPFIIPVCHSSNITAHDGLEPLRTITTERGGGFAVVAPAFTMPLTHHGAQRGNDLRSPLPTITTAHRGEQALVAAWMVQHNFTVAEGVIGTAMDQPLSTLVTRGTQKYVAAASLVKLRGTSTAADIRDPVPTLSAGGNHVAACAAFLTKYYGQGSQSQAANDPLHTLTTLARYGVVTVQFRGKPHALSDIMMRMLAPSEAAAAHELTLPDWIEIDGKRRRLTKSESMRLIGNSVPKRMATLLAHANRVTALDRATVIAAE